MIAVKLVMFSAFDMATFLPIARQVLGRGISGRADSEKLSAESHNMLCVAGLIDGDIEVLAIKWDLPGSPTQLAWALDSNHRLLGSFNSTFSLLHRQRQ